VNVYGQTPLHVLTYNASRDMTEAIEVLLEYGADVNAKNADGNTPLHIAGLTSAREVVNLLVSHGADINTRNLDGETPTDFESRRHGHEKPEGFEYNQGNDR